MKKKNVKISLPKNGSTTKKEKVITLEGELTVNNIQEIQMKLGMEILDEEDLTIELKNVENIDLACLQLLNSIQRYNENIKIKMNLSFHFEQLIENGGFIFLLN